MLNTIEDFHIAIDLEIDKTVDFQFPYIHPEEKDYWLNKGQENVIRQKLFGNNTKGTPYDVSIERIDDLKDLLKIGNLNGSLYNVSLSLNMFKYKIPDDYKFYINSFAKVTKIMQTGYRTIDSSFKVDIIRRDYIDRFLTINGVNKPDLDVVKGFIEDRNIVLIKDGYTDSLGKLNLSYIKEPVKFSISENTITDAKSIKNQILDEAVLLILNNFESNRVETQVQINSKNE